ncbi:MAG: hypothetical protein Ct9H300mP27_00030 [Chloroflexota bacterium]|nr:MAG: hypothetical protein Ct9H300mP27_00030 [Chloroflexota bacterium]
MESGELNQVIETFTVKKDNLQMFSGALYGVITVNLTT